MQGTYAAAPQGLEVAIVLHFQFIHAKVVKNNLMILKKFVMKNITLITTIIIISFSGCSKKDSKDDNNSGNISAADKISGTFNGSGKYMPDKINLGLVKGCNLPVNWESNFKTGAATVNIAKITDSTVKISLTGIFPQIIYTGVKVKTNGNTVEFGSGYYDTNSKFLTLSTFTPGYSYISAGAGACLIGLPYLSGWSPLLDNNYSFQTIGHADFSGTKQ
jgi:hypothetical protein